MAELKRRPGAISKGMKLPITVEDAIDDVLVVCLEHGAKLFKGILLDINKRNLPHGVCVPFSANGDNSKDDPNAHSVNNNAHDVEVSATNFRHTYNRGNDEHVNNFILRSSKDRPARSIRLRPRSTLCSKCKSVCQETEKGIMPVQQIVKQNTQKNQVPQQSLREGLRRRSVQNKDPSINSKQTDNNKNSVVTRSSPFIKISIGEGTVLKIPPRLHDEVDGSTVKSKAKAESVKEESSSEQDKNRRTSKRNLRKTKDRAKRLEEEPPKESETTNENVTSHHKKHKRKHKHKHGDSEEKNQNTTCEGVDENLESATENQNDGVPQRPRLLYTWRQNKGLSPRRENTTDNIENVNKNISMKQNFPGNLSPKRNVRSKSSEQVHKKEYKLRSRERLSVDSMESKRSEEKVQEEDVSCVDVGSENEPEGNMNVSEEPMPDLDMESQETSRDILDCIDSTDSAPVYFGNLNEKHTDYYLHANHDYVVTLNSTNSLSNSIMSTSSEGHDKYVIIDTDKYSVISSASEREFDFKDEDIPMSPDGVSSSVVMLPSPIHHLKPFSPAHQPEPVSHAHELEPISPPQPPEPVEEPVIEEDEEREDIDDAPPTSDDVFRTLMMKIRTHDVPKCMANDGRTIHVGDIVWGKIKGFPWWPGRVLSISVSERDGGIVIRRLAHVSWFGSSTMSHIQCSDLYPFLEDFKLRYNRKKRGPYKVAIKQATIAAQSVTNTHHIDFKEFDL
ncbi:PWWP domain-containing protein 2A-like [Saccostrea echinata]|uniref:PWWP domain-containing protein 2A-like n=1 Tax=Saccostrea echinata TaxID=191078 RepID=UPI002A82D859|nr:PWWP domain-containing protein 2A-like [Saccostrea echinata]